LPEVADYEIRRELLLNNSANALAHLDWLCGQPEYLPITTPIMRQAAALWASARQVGQPTSGTADLDADVIVAAQALSLGDPDVVVATINVAHLSRFVNAELWSTIVP
jgi:predicted nucleic acid-binding protein